MSCEAHRGKYFQHLAENVPGVDAQDLEKLYQNATNRPNEAMAEVVELKTRMLFNDMQQVGLKPPTHSPTGLPKKKSQHGYAAVYDFLKQKGHFDPKKKKRQAEENGTAKSGGKNGPLPPEKFKAAVAEHLREQQESANGHATTAPVKNGDEKSPEKAENAPSERAEAVATEAKPALSLVGMEEEDNREHAARFPVWKHVPRCGKCGRWMSTQNPVCQNPKCGMRGETQGEPVAWPPAGANFKHSRIKARAPLAPLPPLPPLPTKATAPSRAGRKGAKGVPPEEPRSGSTEEEREGVKQRIIDDARTKHALAGEGEAERAPQTSPAETSALRPDQLVIDTPSGPRTVRFEGMDENGYVRYSETVMAGGIPIRGESCTNPNNVAAWGTVPEEIQAAWTACEACGRWHNPAESATCAHCERESEAKISGPAAPKVRPAWAKKGQWVLGEDGRKWYIKKVTKTGGLELSYGPDEPAMVATSAYALYAPVSEEPAPEPNRDEEAPAQEEKTYAAGFVPGKGSAYDYIPEWMDVPPLYASENDPNPLARVKLFTPDSNWTHYVMEYDGKDTCFGLVQGFETELGYFSLSELRAAHGPLGLQPEREIWFAPQPLRETPEYKEKWGEGGPYSGVPAKEEMSAKPVPEEEEAAGSARCEKCGAFMPADGTCNNPYCPTQNEVWEGVADVREIHKGTLALKIGERVGGILASEAGHKPLYQDAEGATVIAEAHYATPEEAVAWIKARLQDEAAGIVTFTDGDAATRYHQAHPETAMYMRLGTNEWVVTQETDPAKKPEGTTLANPPIFKPLRQQPHAPSGKRVVIRVSSAGQLFAQEVDAENLVVATIPLPGGFTDDPYALREGLQAALGTEAFEVGIRGEMDETTEARLNLAFSRCARCSAFVDREGQCNNPRCSSQLSAGYQVTSLADGGYTVQVDGQPPVEVHRHENGSYFASYRPDADGNPVTSGMVDNPDRLMAWAKNTLRDYANWEQQKADEEAERTRQKTEILQRNGLMEQDGKVVGDPGNPEAALAFSAKLRDAARKADQQADVAPSSKVKRLRESARAGYADAERIESTLARCEKCGAFLDKNGECNSPNCPTHRPVMEDDPETYGDSLEDFEAAAFSGIPEEDDEPTSAPSSTQAGANSPQYEVRFNRRKYGSQTYTWAHVKSPVTGEWLSVGDPWPGTTWPKKELARVVADALEYENTSGEEPEKPAAPTQTFSRCEKCGVFMDKNGQCNNAKCPKNTGEAETDENERKQTETNEIQSEEEEAISEEEEAISEDDAFEEPALAVPQGPDYHITDADELGKGGAKTKARQNIEAIKLIKKLDEEGRMATPEEQAVLVKFVGWGGLPQMFDSRNEWWRPGLSYSGQKPEFYDEYQELKKLLTEEEWRAASRSTVNAHYTSATVVRGVWEALKHMGYDRADGNVLEPAVGSGNFFGVMPEEFQASNKVGVELDPFTARIARHLYQNADVRNMGFEKTNLPNDFFDLAISNVPFGNFPVVDREFQGARRFLTRSIHNFFFAKALDKVKPGGTVAFISSRYTLDSKDTSIRKYMAEKADLVGAIRLPNTAFKENAGTEVTTDIIFLRKRLPGEEPGDTSWVNTQTVPVGTDEASINAYFAQHPEMMLGTLSMEGSMYSGRELTVQSDGRPIGEALQEAITRLPKGALAAAHGRCQACGAFLDQNGQCNNPRCPKTRPVETRRVLPEEGMTEGQYLVRPEGVYRLEAGQLVPHEKNGQITADGKEAMEVRRIRGLVALNQAARAVLKLNLEEADETALATAQATLNAEYDAFAQAHGPVNSKANQRALSGDPNLPFLMALENDYDAEKNTARKEAIFSKRVISVNKTVEKADTPQDALRVALNETGMVNWERMAELTGLSVARLQKALLAEGYVYQTPNGAWETAEEYLSGNVRVKLRETEAAAALNPAYQRNVEALKAVVPRDLDATEIKAPLGSPWIPTEDIAAFAKAMLRADFSVSFVSAIAEWKVTPESKNKWLGYDKNSALASQTWGTRQADALSLLQDALNGKEPTIYKTISENGNEKRVVDQDATIAAREMQTKIKEAFEKWLFTSDDERTKRLVTHYNETYNAEVPRRFDGSHLTLPGMGANMPELRAHQKDAIWRISQGQNTLLAHIVGAGKTFSMIGGSMELRRTGLRKKPMHAIPNHMLEQYTADFLRMYPGAKVLAISADDMSEKKRALTMSRIATGDWDAVVVTHSALNKLPVKAESEIEFANEQIEGLREALEAARQEGEKMTVKELEKKLAREEAKLQEKLMKARDRQDNTITFDELGVDQLFVDEADLFKNLDFPTRRTRLAGVQGQASSRAQDLFMKIRVMRKKYGEDQSVVFATGTPIANSVSEMYNMQRFLDYDHLKDLNLAHFDNWASQFGDVVTSIEMKPSGGGYQTKSRFAQFNNVPELKRLFMRFADVQVDPDELNLKRPKLEEDEKGVRRQRGIAAPASDELKAYIGSLVDRAENLKNVDPKDDNMLKITSDGRKAALDMRLIDPYAEDNPDSKLNKAVENVFGIYQKTTGVEVPGVTGKQNMAQMIFCDLGTPNNDGFNAYADIKRKLVARGVKPEEIAFMQDHKSDEAKAELFAKVNAGQVRVLIGSTETMGAGTNAQRRMAALHHLDAPWRPRDVEQREGRIIRQGNMNEEVGVYRYLTEESFDVYNWQLLERKSRFIAQVMNRDLNERSVEDIDAKALTYAEMKALATGNPAVIEKVAVDAELRKLSALEKAYRQRTSDQRVKLERLPRQIADHQEKIRKATAAREATQRALEAETLREAQLKTEVEQARGWAKQMADAAKELGTPEAQERAETAKLAAQSKADRLKRNGAFAMTIRGRQLDEKDDAAKHLAALESDLMKTPAPNGEVEEVGQYMGFPLLAQAPKVIGGEVKFFLKLTDEEAQYIPANKETARTFGGEGRDLTRLGMALNAPAKRIMESQTELAALEKDYAEVKASAGAGFEHQTRLDALLKREQELNGILKAIGSDKQAVAE